MIAVRLVSTSLALLLVGQRTVSDALVEGRGTSGHAARRALVGQLEFALGYRARHLNVEYRYSLRGREYDQQPSSHGYGAVGITVHHFWSLEKTTQPPPS